jgi:NAD(P)H-hydrate epimerase
VLAASEYGAIVRIDDGAPGTEKGADACLVGPGWGRGSTRARILESLLAEEAQGLLLVLDADALHMIHGLVFSGNTILTPHPLEFSDLTGIPKDEVLENPDPHLIRAARERNAVIILKGHVSRIAAPDGRLSYIDGLLPVLASGGTGDVLAGLVVGLGARAKKTAHFNGVPITESFDPFSVAVAAVALLVEAGKAAQEEVGFCDAVEFARMAGRIAGATWLSKELY